MSTPDHSGPDRNASTDSSPSTSQGRCWRIAGWWIKLFVQPVLLLLAGAAVIVGLGVAQRSGWISAGGATSTGVSGHSESGSSYICPMLCTPPQSEPGRCPVCKMELVPATSSGKSDPLAVSIDPAARRIANIQTASVRSVQVEQTITSIGELQYDEGSLKTLAAYIDGRLEKLFADYTGVVVNKGDELGVVYSPRLYTSQVEFLLAKKAQARMRSSSLPRIDTTASARKRLLEAGMTEGQIAKLESSGKAISRLPLVAPMSGTVIEKMANEGEYVKEGQPIYKLADLSNVWLMLKLFPEDAAQVYFGQKVTAEVQSFPGQDFTGRVAFIDDKVDPQTRTVGVRVVISNNDERLKIGDYARATIRVPVSVNASNTKPIRYDPDLADKFISPRHPHIIRSSAGKCPICGVALVPAAQLGFSSTPHEKASLIVPRNAVLMAGNNSVVYVESDPGRFEIRVVKLGPTTGDDIVIIEGVADGEVVATRGNFLIDSQMQLAGNPSLIDPSRAEPPKPAGLSPEHLQVLEELPKADFPLAKEQQICPVTKAPLGSMGLPVKLNIDGKPVFICCAGCEERLRNSPAKYLKNLELVNKKGEAASIDPEHVAEIAKLPAADQLLARNQRICPVANMALGSMGAPIKVSVKGKPVFICCEGCRDRLLKEPAKYLAKLARKMPTTGGATSGLPEITGPMDDEGSGLPPVGVPELIEPAGETPASEAP